MQITAWKALCTRFSHSLVKYQESHSFASLTRSISDTTPTRVKIPYGRVFQDVVSILCMTKISCVLPATSYPSQCTKPLKSWRLHSNHRSLLHWMSRWVFQASVFGLRGKFWTLQNHNYTFIELFCTQIECRREWGSTQARHLLVIFENFENYLEQNWEYIEQNWEYLEQNWIFFEQIWRFRRATVNT